MKKMILLLFAGATLFSCLVIFGLGYFLYSLMPSGQSIQNLAEDGVFMIEEQGRRIEKRISPECVAKLEELTTTASLWNLFRAEDWKELMPHDCLKDINSEGVQQEPVIEKDLDWERQGDSNTI